MDKSLQAPIGHGRGVQTKDGCSVELYKLTPYRGELEGVASLFEERAVLELGCGTGRLTRRLLDLGCAVTAVDESEDMLLELPAKARAIRSSIETLSANARFDVVLLASYLYNNPDKQVRLKFVNSVRRHLKAAGKFLLQVHDERLLTEVDESRTTTADGINSWISDYERIDNMVSMTVHYVVGEEEWRHSFQAQVLTIEEISDELLRVGFTKVDWADRSQGWVIAT